MAGHVRAWVSLHVSYDEVFPRIDLCVPSQQDPYSTTTRTTKTNSAKTPLRQQKSLRKHLASFA